jgi:hypothetical protein
VSDSRDLKRRLDHVLWIGGPPDCGKTSIAQVLAERHNLQVYHFDRHESAHFGRADPQTTPTLYQAHPDRMTTEMRWLGSPPDVMARDTIASWSERCAFAFDDLLTMPTTPRIVAEGPGFFPECLAPILGDPHQAIWLVPSDQFKLTSAIGRNKPGSRWETSDPERAQRNLIERDRLMAEHIRRSARDLGLKVYEVDGTRSLEQVLEDIEAFFAPLLGST